MRVGKHGASALYQSRLEPGAAEFCTPERVNGGVLSLQAADIGSAGLLMYHLLTGKHVVTSKAWCDFGCGGGGDEAAVSRLGQDLCKRLINLEAPGLRPGASQALEHEWFNDAIITRFGTCTEDDKPMLKIQRQKIFEDLVMPPPIPCEFTMSVKTQIGKGHFGTVYSGLWKCNRMPCAVKVMFRGGDRTRELRILSQMPLHSNVCLCVCST